MRFRTKNEERESKMAPIKELGGVGGGGGGGSFPSPSPHFHFLALVSFLARPKPRIPILGLSLLQNQTETLATQAKAIDSEPIRVRGIIVKYSY